MPVFYQRTDGSGFYAKACIQGSIVTFQLTARGAAKLHEAGVEAGGKFPLRLLMSLYRPGDAFTLKGGTGPKAGYHEAEQFAFGFEENQSAEPLFPAAGRISSAITAHTASAATIQTSSFLFMWSLLMRGRVTPASRGSIP